MLRRGMAGGCPGIVGRPGVPHQRALGVRDQKARHGHLGRRELSLFEPVALRRIRDVKRAAIEHI
jgi:hypothetical protein